MQKYSYRNPRFCITSTIEVNFRPSENPSISGRCTDISLEGLGVEFESDVPIGTHGVLEFSDIEIPAHVAYSDGSRHGLVFGPLDKEQQSAIEKFIESNSVN